MFNKKAKPPGTQPMPLGERFPSPLEDFADRVYLDYPLSQDIFEKHLKQDAALEWNNVRLVTRTHGTTAEYGGFRFYPDANYFFILAIEGKSVACIGFNLVTQTNIDSLKGKCVLIKQIQGRKNYRPQLNNLKWERMLIEVVIEWARNHNMNEVRIIHADQQAYWPDKQGQLESTKKNLELAQYKLKEGNFRYPTTKASQEAYVKQYQAGIEAIEQKMASFHIRYNVTPKRMGFRPGKDYQYIDLRSS